MIGRARYYFIGIGGIGMSALARYMHASGADVAGYDRTASELTRSLEAEGIGISYQDEVQKVPMAFQSGFEDLLVVRTPAVPLDSAILQYYTAVQAQICKRSELLAALAGAKTCIAIAGTHGKTTTTSILAHILHSTGRGCTAFVGGIMPGYESNLILDAESDLVVLEADEFDRSFHYLKPQMAVITSTDPDHLDIYDDIQSFELAFQEFADRVAPDGLLLHAEEVTHLGQHDDRQSYGIETGKLQARHVHVARGQFHFDLHSNTHTVSNLSLSLPGRHNVLNALAACGLALELGVAPERLASALKSYPGVKRRFETHIQEDNLVYIDDYAHHPTEISACISSVRELYPGKKISVVFQPHLFSRTRDFMTEFGESLSMADEIVLLPIYPAREKPIAGVTSEALLKHITVTNSLVCEKEELPTLIAAKELEVLLTLGAGDIDRLVPALNKVLNPA